MSASEVGRGAVVAPAGAAARAARLTAMAVENFQFIWRSLRRLGVPPEGVDDAAQQVFVVAATKVDAIDPGRERAYLYMTAVRVAADALRASMAEKDVLVAELRQALVEVKTLSGLLPFCMYCKKIRDGQGYWEEVERYISAHTDARFSHGVCDRCYAEAERRMG